MNSLLEYKINEFITRNSTPQLNISIWNDGIAYESLYGCSKKSNVDVFEIGSIGKTFTATLLEILHESDVVNLDDRVSRFRPDLSFASEITLKNLATHTSGLPSNPFNVNLLSHSRLISKVKDFKQADFDDCLASIRKPLKAKRFAYSNLGMALLGNILAECVGSTYEEAVKEYLLIPLGINDTHAYSDSYELDRLASGHDANGNPVDDFIWSCMEPAGVWRSTTKDMMVFLKAHLGYSGETWKNLLCETTRQAYDDPKLKNVGLAWMRANRDKLGSFAWHNGETFGQRSMAIISKERNMAIIILTNKIPKLWHRFFCRFSLEKLAEDALLSLLQKGR